MATLNTGSNNGTLITGLTSASPQAQTFPTGGDRPTSGFEFTNNGFTDLVVGNNADGQLSLRTGGPGGLSLSQTLSNVEAPNPTDVSFGGISDGLLNFYVSTAGHEAAMNLAFDLSAGPGGPEGPEAWGGLTAGSVTPTEGSAAEVLSQATSGSVAQVAQLLSLSGTTLDLAATFLTVSVVDIESGGGSSATGGSGGPGQGSTQANGDTTDSADEPIEEENQGSPAIIVWAPAWERLAIGRERSWERARNAILQIDGRLPVEEARKVTASPAAGQQPAPPVSTPSGPATRDRTGRRPNRPSCPRLRRPLPCCRWLHHSFRGERTPPGLSMPRWATWVMSRWTAGVRVRGTKRPGSHILTRPEHSSGLSNRPPWRVPDGLSARDGLDVHVYSHRSFLRADCG